MISTDDGYAVRPQAANQRVSYIKANQITIGGANNTTTLTVRIINALAGTDTTERAFWSVQNIVGGGFNTNNNLLDETNAKI